MGDAAGGEVEMSTLRQSATPQAGAPKDNNPAPPAATEATSSNDAAAPKEEDNEAPDTVVSLAMETSMKDMKAHDDITVETVGHNVVWLANAADVELFRTIRIWKDQHGTKDIQNAFKEFVGTRQGGFKDKADAFIRVLYASRDVDYILKYENQSLSALRVAWERKLVQAGLVVELEPALDRRHTYVKIYTPFSVLSREAEKQKLMVVLQDHPDNPLQKPIDGDTEDEGVDIDALPQEKKSRTELLKKLDAHNHDLVNPPKGVGELFSRVHKFFDPQFTIDAVASAKFKLDSIAKFQGGPQVLPCLGSAPREEVVQNFFPPSKRNLLTYYIITRIMLSPKEVDNISNSTLVARRSLAISHLLRNKAYTKFYPLHEGSADFQKDLTLRSWLNRNWVKKIFSFQPLDAVADYFGEKIALYFAFIGFYTMWLFPMALLGLACFGYGVYYALKVVDLGSHDVVTLSQLDNIEQTAGRIFDNAATIPFAALTCIWATLFVEFWKRKNAYLAWWWDVLAYEQSETPRPEWYGTRIRVSPVTNKKEFYYPQGVKRLKMAASFVSITAAIIFILISVAATVVYTAWANNHFGECNITTLEYRVCVQGKTLVDDQNNTVQYNCTDPCYNLTSQVACEAQTFVISTVSYPSCKWYNESGDAPVCGPGCPNIVKGIPCISDPSNVLVGKRAACYWRDKFFIGNITASLLNLFVIVVMNNVFAYFASFLNEWENHRTQTEWEDSLITKTFFFQFLNSYTTLFYIAFFKGTLAGSIFGRPELHDFCQFGSCFNELMIQLAVVFLGKQFVNQFFEVFLPVFMKFFNKTLQERQNEAAEEYKKKAKKDPQMVTKELPQWISDDYLTQDDSLLFDDYNEMVQQFGFITLFVAAFPLAPFFALVNNIFEIRTDAFKLITAYQRPPALQARDIGTWETIINIMGIACVLTNAFVVGFTSNWVTETITNLSETKTAFEILAGRLVFIIVFEHVVIGFKIMFALLIPDIPATVKLAMERENYQARLALENLPEDPDMDETAEEVLDSIFQSVVRSARTQMSLFGQKKPETNV